MTTETAPEKAPPKCDCCGHTDLLAGVASSGLGAFSIMWCQICLAMGAEPRFAVDFIRESNPHFRFRTFDVEKDCYVDQDGAEVPVRVAKDVSLLTRRDVSRFVESLPPESSGG